MAKTIIADPVVRRLAFAFALLDLEDAPDATMIAGAEDYVREHGEDMALEWAREIHCSIEAYLASESFDDE